jgi:23S rRNA pseudouridine1911/1915/1917 synthase
MDTPHRLRDDAPALDKSELVDHSPSIEHWLIQNVAGQDALTEAGLCNRLDVVTSGCILVAKSMDAREQLRAGLRSGDILKHYLALCVGKFQAPDGSFDLFFSGRYRRSRKVCVRESGPVRHQGSCKWHVLSSDHVTLPTPTAAHPTPPAAPEAHSAYSPSTEAAQGQKHDGAATAAQRRVYLSLLCIQLVGAGQRHQIRAGMAHLGKPILGDVEYGGPEWPFAGIALHSHKLSINGTVVSSQTPEHMRSVFPLR